jgi:hypothetical protein
MNVVDYYMDKLPYELLDIIFSYLPDISKLRLNKYYYKKYHNILNKFIKNGKCESYIRCMVRQDNDFVIKHIINDNYSKWLRIMDYYYDGLEFNNYLHFFKYYCSENNSQKCENVIAEFNKSFLK